MVAMCSNGALFATEMIINAVCISLVVFSHMRLLRCKVKLFCLVNKQTYCPLFEKKNTLNERNESKFMVYCQYSGLVLDTVHALEQLSITQRIDITAHAVCAACPDIKNKDIQCQSSPELNVLMTLLYGRCLLKRFGMAVFQSAAAVVQRGGMKMWNFLWKKYR